MKYKLIDIGRDKVNRVVEVATSQDLLNEVSQYLLSRNIGLVTDDEGESFRVYAGVRRVGEIEIIKTN